MKAGIKPPQQLTEFQRDLLLRFAASDETQQLFGSIEGLETPDSHRYSAGVIEPDQIKRYFNTAEEKEREKREKNEKKTIVSEYAKDWKNFKDSLIRKWF